ncbi:MAG: class I SAM-dependent methyltransferase, partial [Anaerolineales bacterium]|nr:class I SAM-dependent methyltransferase [Anaerolineales bacterium]
MNEFYDEKYKSKEFYWGQRPSNLCFQVMQFLPPDRPLSLLDIGCGEGKDAVFLARNGYHVEAFDISKQGVNKAITWSRELGVPVHAFTADLLEFRLDKQFDVLYSNGVLHLLPESLRVTVFNNYKEWTRPNGIHAFSVFVEKPFIAAAPDSEEMTQRWISGELF